MSSRSLYGASSSPLNDAAVDFKNLLHNNDCSDDEACNSAFGGNNNDNSSQPTCWIFGYGSLCWNPGFEYEKCVTGYIRDYVRRFWQGNTTHRGTPEKPGRVATLVETKGGMTWGCAYKISGQTALDYLKQRECTLGGYTTLEAKFYPRVASYDTPFSGEAFEVLVYIANPQSVHWLGEDTLDNIAKQVVECRGPSRHNAEYVLRLAKFMHEEIPDAIDEHLFELESLVFKNMSDRGIELTDVLGADPLNIRRDSHEDIKKATSFEFTSRIKKRKLRCLHI